MRILWITNMLLPDIAVELQGSIGARRSGTWLDNWLYSIKNAENIELAVACVGGKHFIEKKIDGVTYFVLPGNGRTMLLYHPSLIKQWRKVEEAFHPEIVHIHGTEYTHGISYIRTYPDKKFILSIQGLLGPISRECYGGISGLETHMYRTMRERLHASGTVGVRRIYNYNKKFENEMIMNAQLAIGRYDFDRFYVQSINERIKYARCNYSLREEFYSAEKWNADTAERHTIYAGAAVTTALKGGHMLLKAVAVVKRRYPDVKVVFVGVGDAHGNLSCNGGYKRYIKKLVSKLGLEENVEYLPVQSAEGIIQAMNRSYCAVIPSAMDNGSTMLREALHLGVPAIASFRGGLTGLIKDGESGFFFDYPEYTFLAGRIIQLFEDRELAVRISNNAMNVANLLHDKKKNANELIALYQEVSQS